MGFFYKLKIAYLANEYNECVEEKRQSDRKSMILFMTVIVGVIVLLNHDDGGWFALFFFIIIFIYISSINRQLNSLLSKFKNKTIKIMLTYFSGDFNYLEEDFIANNYLAAFGVLPAFDSKTSTGCVFGEYKGMAVKMIHTSLSKEVGDGTEVVFKGLIFIVKLENEFSEKTVASSGYQHNYKKLPRVHLTNSFFNSEFYVYSNNRKEASTLLTPSFMKQLFDFEKQTGLSLTFSFNAESLLISIPSEFPDFSFYWNGLRHDFDNFMERMQFMFDVLDMLKHKDGDD